MKVRIDKRVKLTDEDKKEIVRLRDEGWSWGRLAKKFEVSREEMHKDVDVSLTTRELAEMIGVKEDTIRSVMSRCRKSGRKCRYVRVDF